MAAKNSRILYLGLIFQENGTWQVRQWLPEQAEEEKKCFRKCSDSSPRFSCLIHYNGNSFDLPCPHQAMQLP
ncbi:MAG: ribonuclease H-like domain-containing protein [Blautia sp.]